MCQLKPDLHYTIFEIAVDYFSIDVSGNIFNS